MIRTVHLFLFTFILSWSFTAQAQYNITLAGHLSYQQLRNSNLSNIWGYTDELGNEYSIVGVNGNNGGVPGGVSIANISNPADPQEVFFTPGPASIWREVKVWGDHAYITTEAEPGGITIIDMSPLPQSTDLPTTVFFGDGWDTSHSLFIDENGRLYLFGSSRGNGGTIMYDLTQNPMAPVEVGEYDNWYVHDGYARGDTLYAAHIYNGFFSIVDVSNPAAPVILGTQSTPDIFTHNVWLDDSGDHLFTTDEKVNAYVGAYDISDPTDIQYLDKLQSDAGSGAVPHNTYWLNDFLVTSYYTYGVTIYDAMRPDNLVEVGHYDTSPISGEGFNGAWGVYPFFGSQRLIVSDIQEGLFILDPVYIRACWLEGSITDASTSSPIAQATVTIVGPDVSDVSMLNGTYATGYHQAGTYTVLVSAPGYTSATVEGVVLENGEVTILDVALDPLFTFNFQGTVVDGITGDPIEGAQVVIENDIYWFSATTDENGAFTHGSIFEDTYDITAARWGWITSCLDDQVINTATSQIQIQLQPGYYDDMVLDLGWTVSSTANSGMWVRDTPVGTTFQNEPSNPGSDVAGDCGDKAYVTGNGGGGAGNDDVDDGWSLLSSPVFDLMGMLDPYVQYRHWFYNSGGAGSPNDKLTFSLTNGIDSVQIENVTVGPASNSWQESEIRVMDYLSITDQMRLHVYVVDDEPGHLVEAGFDLFRVIELGTIGMEEGETASGLRIWPNPSNGTFEVRTSDMRVSTIGILDVLGRSVLAPTIMKEGNMRFQLDLPQGTYLLRVATEHEAPKVQRFVIE